MDPFHPPASMASARARKAELATAWTRINEWLATHGKKHHGRPRVLAELQVVTDEQRHLRQWMRSANESEERAQKPAIVEEKAARLIEGLYRALDRLADEGVRLTDEEHAHLDHAAVWLEKRAQVVARAV